MPTPLCKPWEHELSRRLFLGGTGTAVGAGAFGGLLGNVAGEKLAARDKQVLFIWLDGGISQLESWDPKPGTKTGGPFRAIPTSVPGIHVSELLPMTAKQMHHLCLVRGVNTSENDHGKGSYAMFHGRRQMPGGNFPKLGAVAARALRGTIIY